MSLYVKLRLVAELVLALKVWEIGHSVTEEELSVLPIDTSGSKTSGVTTSRKASVGPLYGII